MLEKLKELKKINSEMKSEMKQYEKCHPKRIKKLDDDTATCFEASNTWTDNLFETQKYFKNSTGA